MYVVSVKNPEEGTFMMVFDCMKAAIKQAESVGVEAEIQKVKITTNVCEC